MAMTMFAYSNKSMMRNQIIAEAASVPDPYIRSKNKIPISENAVLIAGNANKELA